MKAALYARVSSEEQIEGYSLDAQIRAFRAFVQERGWIIYREYIDKGVSAHTDDVSKRPLFREAVGDALNQKYDVLIVHKLDRFARNVRITLEYLEKLEKAGCSFVSLNEQLDFSTPIGKVMLANLAAFGQYYSDNLSAEVKKGLAERAMQGLWVGPVPFGYSAGDDGLLVTVPGEADLVVRCYELYASGCHTGRTIATWLNQTEFRPRARRRNQGERQYLWTTNNVRDMLKNAFYLGYVKYKGELIPGKHPAIVSQELFKRVQQIRKEHYCGPSTFTPRYRTYLLKGLLRCVHCGEKVWAQHINGYDYYREQNSARGVPCPNPTSYHRTEVFDSQVCQLMEQLTLPTSWRELVLEFFNSSKEREEDDKERYRLEEKLRRVKLQFREGDIDPREYQQEMELTRSSLAKIHVPEDNQLLELGDHVEGLVAAWEHATKEERHDLLKMMLDGVYVDMTEATVVAVQPKPPFLPLFNLKEPVRSGEALLVAGGIDQSRTPRPLVTQDSDEVRSWGQFLILSIQVPV